MSPCTPQASTTPMSLKNKNISFKDGLWFYKAKLTYLQGRNRITVLFGTFKTFKTEMSPKSCQVEPKKK